MAYVTGELNGSGPFYVGMDVNYSGVQDWGGNSSRFVWAVYVGCWNNGWGTWSGGGQSWSCSIGGVGYSGQFTLDFRPSGSSGRRYAVGSGDTWHGHDGNGYRGGFPSNAYISTNHGSVGSGGSGDAWVDAPRIPKPPSAPRPQRIDQVSATSIRYEFIGPADDGGNGMIEYEVQRATNSAFTTGVASFTTKTGLNGISGLANHTTYYVRVRGRNGIGWSGWSGALSATTTGHPTAPGTPSATPSPSVVGRITLSWTPPATTGAGGIVGYNIFRDGTQIATTTGAGTTYNDTGLNPYSIYSYRVAARNAYSTSAGGIGPQSAATSAVAPGPPSAPVNLTAVSSSSTPGEVTLSWVEPANVGAGGITGYTIRYADNTLATTTTGTATTRVISGLTPGLTYTFKVAGRNALADTAGIEGPYSNEAVVTPIGEPNAPTNLTVTPSPTVANRLVLSWGAPSGVLSGYSIFRLVSGAYQLIGKVNATNTSFTVDDLPAGTAQTFQVRARTVYTDTLSTGYPGNWGGPATSAVTATPSLNHSQTVPSLPAVNSLTNVAFNGTFPINAVTATTVRYARTFNGSIPTASAAGTITNSSNAALNGTFTISTPTPSTISYAKTSANVPLLPTAGGVVTDTSNVDLNGTYTVTSVNVGANIISYTKAGADFASRTVPVNAFPGQFSQVTNLSNAIFNGSGKVLIAVTDDTMSYNQTNANVVESNAAGIVTNTTNGLTFNGLFTVSSIPAYNTVQYEKTASNVPLRTWTARNGEVFRTLSPALLDVRFRSGWSG